MAEGDKMNVSITLKDPSDDKRVELANSGSRDKVHITIYHGRNELSAEISIEEIKHALRKISTR